MTRKTALSIKERVTVDAVLRHLNLKVEDARDQEAETATEKNIDIGKTAKVGGEMTTVIETTPTTGETITDEFN